MVINDFLALEVYKFAGSELAESLETILNSSQPDIADLCFQLTVAQKVKDTLKSAEEEKAKEIYAKLNELDARVKDYVKNYQIVNEEKTKILAAEVIGNAFRSGRIYFDIAMVHYYAGERLKAVIGKVMERKEANQKWYEFCKSFKNRILEFAGSFMADYEGAKTVFEQEGKAYAIKVAKELNLPESEGSPMHAYFCAALQRHHKNFKMLMIQLNSSIERIRNYVVQHQHV